MYKKLDQKKVFRDPVYGYINVRYQLISDLIDSKAFQRLRRITHLSGVKMVFHGAEHSRFNHSLGVYHLAIKLLDENDTLNQYFDEHEKMILMISALMHDIGHGPYSHAFERVFKLAHETYGANIILNDPEISSLLDNANKGLKESVSSVLLKTGKHPEIEQLVSSQIDIDRLDYLTRDAYYTGANYGRLDLDRIIRMMAVKDNNIVYKEGAIHAIENYLVSRYHMYWQVYYHPVARSYEIMLEKIFLRIYDLIEQNKLNDEYTTLIKKVIESNVTLDAYLELDDFYVNAFIKKYAHHKDSILSELCSSFLDRKLFDYLEFKENNLTKISEVVKRYKDNPYFIEEEVVSQKTYLIKDYDIKAEDILILTKEQAVKPIDEVSPIIKGLVSSGIKTERKLYFKHE
ncbi:MAG: HD domain-containing protein [Acholeplasmataceae bacterium]|nr:HD domain-containing protein [Acholeplasmataceae bacterium]